jgi:hypothetical protein
MSRKDPFYIVFGADHVSVKGVLIGKSDKMSGYECHLVGMKEGSNYAAGDTIDATDIDRMYATLYFTRLESLRAFANAINETVKRWEEEKS